MWDVSDAINRLHAWASLVVTRHMCSTDSMERDADNSLHFNEGYGAALDSMRWTLHSMNVYAFSARNGADDVGERPLTHRYFSFSIGALLRMWCYLWDHNAVKPYSSPDEQVKPWNLAFSVQIRTASARNFAWPSLSLFPSIDGYQLGSYAFSQRVGGNEKLLMNNVHRNAFRCVTCISPRTGPQGLLWGKCLRLFSRWR